MEDEVTQSQVSMAGPKASDLGLNIVIKINGKEVANTTICMVPGKEQLKEFIQNIVSLQCDDIVSKL